MFKKAFVLLSFATLAACGPSQQPPPDQTAAATPPPAAAAPVAEPAPGPSANDAELARIKAEQRKLQRQQNELAAQQQQAAAAPPPPPPCQDCGVVAAITPVKQAGQAGLVGGLGGAALGGLAGNQFGHGKGKTAMTVVGVLGGAFAGAETQKALTSTTVYQVAVNMEAGGQRTVTISSVNGLAPGSRVHVDGNNLQPY